jgi:hypothetical protein
VVNELLFDTKQVLQLIQFSTHFTGTAAKFVSEPGQFLYLANEPCGIRRFLGCHIW